MTEFLRMYNVIYTNQKDYCVICMRTSDERRMGDLKTLEKFIHSINLPFSYTAVCQKICFICERGAAAAYQFRLAVNLSGALHGLFHAMGRSQRTYDDIEKQILGLKPQSAMTRHTDEWSARLRAVRARSLLLRTETLSVNSLVMPGQNIPAEGALRESHRGPYVGMHMIPGVTPAPSAPIPDPEGEADPQKDTFEESEIYMESVDLVKDEIDPIQIKHEDPGFDELTVEDEFDGSPEPPKEIAETNGHEAPTRHSHLSSSIMLNTTAPTTAPCLVPIENLINGISTTNLALIPNGLVQRNPIEPTNFILHPIVHRDGMIIVPSLAAQIVNGKLITCNQSNIIIQTPKIVLQDGPNFNVMTDPNQVTHLLNNLCSTDTQQVTAVSENISTDMLQSNLLNIRQVNVNNQPTVDKMQKVMKEVKRRGNGSVIGAIQDMLNDTNSNMILDDSVNVDKCGVGGRGKRMSKRSKRDGKEVATDWEDEIPREVIATIDGVDPNASEILAPLPLNPMISNIHSVGAAATSTNVGIHSSKNIVHSKERVPTENSVTMKNINAISKEAFTFSVHSKSYVPAKITIKPQTGTKTIQRGQKSSLKSAKASACSNRNEQLSKLRCRATAGVKGAGRKAAQKPGSDVIDLC